jgi:hypothetical protein
MSVSFPFEVSRPNSPSSSSSGKITDTWIGAYRVVVLTLIFILAIVEAGLSTSGTGHYMYTLGAAITTIVFTVAGFIFYRNMSLASR